MARRSSPPAMTDVRGSAWTVLRSGCRMTVPQADERETLPPTVLSADRGALEPRLACKRLHPPPCRARLPIQPPGTMFGIVGESLARSVGIAAHRMERKRLDMEGLDAVGVAVLRPAVD